MSLDPKSSYYDINLSGGEPIETIDIIRAKLTPEQFKGFLLGNMLKYSCRMNAKGVADRDAEKVLTYAKLLSETATVTDSPSSPTPRVDDTPADAPNEVTEGSQKRTRPVGDTQWLTFNLTEATELDDIEPRYLISRQWVKAFALTNMQVCQLYDKHNEAAKPEGRDSTLEIPLPASHFATLAKYIHREFK